MKISHVLKVRLLCTLQHGSQPRGQRSLTQVSSGKSLRLCLLSWLGFRDLATLFFVKVCMCSYEKPGWPGYQNFYDEECGEARSRKPSHCGFTRLS